MQMTEFHLFQKAILKLNSLAERLHTKRYESELNMDNGCQWNLSTECHTVAVVVEIVVVVCLNIRCQFRFKMCIDLMRKLKQQPTFGNVKIAKIFTFQSCYSKRSGQCILVEMNRCQDDFDASGI